MNNVPLPMKSPAGRTPQKAYKHVKFMPLAHVRRVVDIRDNDGKKCITGVLLKLTLPSCWRLFVYFSDFPVNQFFFFHRLSKSVWNHLLLPSGNERNASDVQTGRGRCEQIGMASKPYYGTSEYHLHGRHGKSWILHLSYPSHPALNCLGSPIIKFKCHINSFQENFLTTVDPQELMLSKSDMSNGTLSRAVR